MSDRLEIAAGVYDKVAVELEQALAHVRVAAAHYRNELVPQGAAHALAARGHLLSAQRQLDAQAIDHAANSVADAD